MEIAGKKETGIMGAIRVRTLAIGEGMPKICVPIVATQEEDIVEQAQKIIETSADMIEWRLDFLEGDYQAERLEEILTELREIMENRPILATFRTKQEGGEREITKEAYQSLYRNLIRSKQVDLIDLEYFLGEDVLLDLIKEAREKQVKIILSNHDFEKTPPQPEMLQRLKAMQDLGADIVKLAVMPQKKEDVLALLAATKEMTERYPSTPVVTMSMGKKGIVSRTSGEIYGSSITFGIVGKASAPGQIPVEDLRIMMTTVHNSIER